MNDYQRCQQDIKQYMEELKARQINNSFGKKEFNVLKIKYRKSMYDDTRIFKAITRFSQWCQNKSGKAW